MKCVVRYCHAVCIHALASVIQACAARASSECLHGVTAGRLRKISYALKAETRSRASSPTLAWGVRRLRKVGMVSLTAEMLATASLTVAYWSIAAHALAIRKIQIRVIVRALQMLSLIAPVAKHT